MRCYIARKLSGVIERYRGFLPIGQGNWVLSHTRHPHAFNPVSHQDHLFLWVSGGWVSSFQNQRYQMRSQHVYVSLVAQSCPTPCSAMDCSLPGSSVHGILQARILEWVTMPSSGESSVSRDQTHVSGFAGGFFTTEPPEKPIAGHVSCQHKIISVCELLCQPQGSSTRDRIVENL